MFEDDLEAKNGQTVNQTNDQIRNFKTITLKNPISPLTVKDFQNNKEEAFNGYETKKQKFENFLTYRKRLSRLSLSQGLYFHEQFKKMNDETLSLEEEVNEIYRVIIYFYKKMFFIEKYGDNKKNKKLDEKFLRNGIKNYIIAKEKIDSYIKQNIKKSWCIGKLNCVIRASLRSAICEALFAKNPNFKIIVSEYTTLVSGSVFNEKEIAFFNAVLDNTLKQIKLEKK